MEGRGGDREALMCLYGYREVCLWRKGVYLAPLDGCPEDCPIRQDSPRPQAKARRFKGSNAVVMP